MTSSDDSSRVLSNWRESAQAWDKHREARRMLAGSVMARLNREAAIPEAPPSIRYDVLEVAAGPGEASLDLAEELGPNATVWSTDLVPEMVESGRRAAARRGVANVRFQQCRGEQLPFEMSFFDAVLCCFGIMFFSNPLAGVREALRVLKPGGRVAYCVWGPYAANPYHHVLTDVLNRYVPGPPGAPDAPGAFRFAAPGKLKAILIEAGAQDVRECSYPFRIEAPLTFDQFFEIRTEMSDSLRDKLRRMPGDELLRFKEDVRKNAARYFSADGCELPAEVVLVSGQR